VRHRLVQDIVNAYEQAEHGAGREGLRRPPPEKKEPQAGQA
jgi:hypothetical protein